jgi:hypothetical protein
MNRRAQQSAGAIHLQEVKYVTLGRNLFDNRTGGGAVWIYWHRRGGGWNCEVSLLSLPGDLPDSFYYRHLSRQKNPVTQGTSCDFWSTIRGKVPDGQNSVEVRATALMTAPDWTGAPPQRDANGDDALRFLAI